MQITNFKSVFIFLIPTIFFTFFHISIAESQPTEVLPVILIHGYRQDESSWNAWEELLSKDGIPYYPASFEDDFCGSAAEHARELVQLVEFIKQEEQSDKVNIVGFSKGGLDARVYLQDDNENVANLIMIGTPNDGAPLAQWDILCDPASEDLEPGSLATKAERNPNTNYYTISANYVGPWWISNGFWGFWTKVMNGNPYIPGPDDGLVPVGSVESKPYFHNIGHPSDYHLDLQTENEYRLTRSILGKN
ncbi:MAG: esterase/lipase family protein [Nitrososphaeraceae archaeon]|jgi:triacylglycerol lipase